MRQQGTVLRTFLTVVGGALALLGLIGVYVQSLSLTDLMSFVSTPLGVTVWNHSHTWPYLLALGLVFIQLGNVRVEIGKWHLLIPGLSANSSAFYESVQEHVRKRRVPTASSRSVYACQRGVLGSIRRYLRIRGSYFTFDLLAAPFGEDFGFSWRCYYRPRLLERACLALPVLGWICYYLFFRYTRYTEDKGVFFQSAVHDSVKALVEREVDQRGLRALGEHQLQPIVSDLYRR